MSGDVTSWLQAHKAGDRDALDRVIPVLYDQLSAIARRQLGKMPPGSLDVSGLVTETYLRLIDEHGVDWKDRAHFLAICARTLLRRNDRARNRGRAQHAP